MKYGHKRPSSSQSKHINSNNANWMLHTFRCAQTNSIQNSFLSEIYFSISAIFYSPVKTKMNYVAALFVHPQYKRCWWRLKQRKHFSHLQIKPKKLSREIQILEFNFLFLAINQSINQNQKIKAFIRMNELGVQFVFRRY